MSKIKVPSNEKLSSASAEATEPTSPPPSKKRKRDVKSVEIEVDINAPEPPSKKALRRAKKGKPAATATSKVILNDSASEFDDDPGQAPTEERTVVHGIWIGNLPWTATKASLISFLTNNTSIKETEIIRLNIPGPSRVDANGSRQHLKPQNKGFAYVDFSNQTAQTAAIALSETLLTGRRVLIKDSKSFEGRPDPANKTTKETGNPPNKRIFVGNLGFDITQDELRGHFEKCGQVADVFMATFLDSGACKGYAWVTFENVDAAQKAVRGWVEWQQDSEEEKEEKEKEEEEEEEEEGQKEGDEEGGSQAKKAKKAKKKTKPRKWFVNRLKGRDLRMEFAEDAVTRYKKRFGKGEKGNKENKEDEPMQDVVPTKGDAAEISAKGDASTARPGESRNGNPSSGRKLRSSGHPGKKVDARDIKPGAAHVGAPRLTGAIVEGQGKKTTFA